VVFTEPCLSHSLGLAMTNLASYASQVWGSHQVIPAVPGWQPRLDVPCGADRHQSATAWCVI
jgi:hypothetical protein